MARLDLKTVDIRRAVLRPNEDLPYGTKPVMRKCPNHADDAASLAIFVDGLKCFGCDFQITKRMEALAWILKLPGWEEAIKVAGQYVRLPETERQIQKAATRTARLPTLLEVGIYERLLYGLCSERLRWLLERGLTLATIRRARFGHTGSAFVIPLFDGEGKLVTLRYRNDDLYGKVEAAYDDEEKPNKISKYRGWKGHNNAYLYPLWRFENDRRNYMVLVEGELDALLLWQHGVPALTATNGASQQSVILKLLATFFGRTEHAATRRPKPTQVVICGDRDAPGILAARKLFEEASAEYDEVLWLQWPLALGKDITEVMQKGNSFDEVYQKYGYAYELTDPISTDYEALEHCYTS